MERIGDDDDNVNNDDLFPELGLGFDGQIYINIAGFKYPERLQNRAQFIGWELNGDEFSWEGAADLKLRDLRGVVGAVDGTFYGDADRIPPEKRTGRHMFRGFALRQDERNEAFAQMQMMAFNVTIGVQAAFAAKRRKRASASKGPASSRPDRAHPTRKAANSRRAV
jgi:hypothetical protein